MPADADSDSLREDPAPYSPPPETQRLIDELYREEVIEARAMSLEDKLLAGEDLFHSACAVTMWGIRNQFPDADETERQRILESRIELQRKLEGRT